MCDCQAGPGKPVCVKNQIIIKQCREIPGGEFTLCDYQSLVTPITGGPFFYPFSAQITFFYISGPVPPVITTYATVFNHSELIAKTNDDLLLIANEQGIYPYGGASVVVSGNDGVQVDSVQITLEGMNQANPPSFVTLRLQTLDLNRTSNISFTPLSEQNCSPETIEYQRFTKIVYEDGTIKYFDDINCVFVDSIPAVSVLCGTEEEPVTPTEIVRIANNVNSDDVPAGRRYVFMTVLSGTAVINGVTTPADYSVNREQFAGVVYPAQTIDATLGEVRIVEGFY